jgi:hypothetical protein
MILPNTPATMALFDLLVALGREHGFSAADEIANDDRDDRNEDEPQGNGAR